MSHFDYLVADRDAEFFGGMRKEAAGAGSIGELVRAGQRSARGAAKLSAGRVLAPKFRRITKLSSAPEAEIALLKMAAPSFGTFGMTKAAAEYMLELELDQENTPEELDDAFNKLAGESLKHDLEQVRVNQGMGADEFKSFASAILKEAGIASKGLKLLTGGAASRAVPKIPSVASAAAGGAAKAAPHVPSTSGVAPGAATWGDKSRLAGGLRNVGAAGKARAAGAWAAMRNPLQAPTAYRAAKMQSLAQHGEREAVRRARGAEGLRSDATGRVGDPGTQAAFESRARKLDDSASKIKSQSEAHSAEFKRMTDPTVRTERAATESQQALDKARQAASPPSSVTTKSPSEPTGTLRKSKGGKRVDVGDDTKDPGMMDSVNKFFRGEKLSPAERAQAIKAGIGGYLIHEQIKPRD